MSTDSYTVEVRNELLGKLHHQGTYDSYGEAEESARSQAERSRSFATYQVYRGTPRRPTKAVGPLFRGKH